MFICCCVLLGRGLCDELITRPGESCRLWRFVMCDLETSRMKRPWPTGGGGRLSRQKQRNKQIQGITRFLCYVSTSGDTTQPISKSRFYVAYMKHYKLSEFMLIRESLLNDCLT